MSRTGAGRSAVVRLGDLMDRADVRVLEGADRAGCAVLLKEALMQGRAEIARRYGAALISDETMRRAMIYGSVMASFNVEKFGTERVDELDYPEINQRFRDFKRMTHFDDVPFERAVSKS